jgi:Thiamine pyrophosphate enzyme, N-terminal TPP binding domain
MTLTIPSLTRPLRDARWLLAYDRPVNGAQALMASLVGAGVDVCFMNPGTSEMHFVSALDSAPAMRGVLALFEGVATGAADGYARIKGRPAAVLLHLGPGLANGLANLHNAVLPALHADRPGPGREPGVARGGLRFHGHRGHPRYLAHRLAPP